jgi:hypothetical protein
MHEIMIGYCSGDRVHPAFLQSLADWGIWDAYNRKTLHSITHAKGPSITDNRNRIVEKFLVAKTESGYFADWLLFIDSDIKFKVSDPYTLLEYATKLGDSGRIMSGLYFGRPGSSGKIVPVWYEFGEDNNKDFYMINSMNGKPCQKIDGCGMGFCLVHRSIFEAFPDQNDPWRWFGRDLQKMNGVWTRVSEDLTFCYRAGKNGLGFDIWGNRAVALDHIKEGEENLARYINETGIKPVVQSSTENSKSNNNKPLVEFNRINKDKSNPILDQATSQ